MTPRTEMSVPDIERAISRVERGTLLRLVDAELMRHDLASYMRWAWPINPEHKTSLEWNWHLDAKAEHLQACKEGQIRRLIINEPPRHLKSWTVSVAFPSWCWASNPALQFLVASSDDDVRKRDADAMREICMSPAYQAMFRPKWNFKAGPDNKQQDAKGYYRNSAGGHRISKVMGQRGQGVNADVVIFDDPLDASDAYSDKAALAEHAVHAKQRLMTRLNDERTGVVILIMQRLHEIDLTGVFLEDGGWEHLYMPAEFEVSRRCWTGIDWTDPRTEEGELLFPARMSQEKLDEKKVDLGSRGYAGQFQQRPVPAHGAMVQKVWIQFWDPKTLPADLDFTIGSWDCTFASKTKDADFVVGQTWGAKGDKIYLLDQVRQRMDVPEMLAAIREQNRLWPNLFAIVIEERAAGRHVMDTLSREICGIEGFNPHGQSKEERLSATLPLWEQKRIHLPDWEECGDLNTDFSWVRDKYIPELTSFPAARHDDQVDASSQALIWMMNNAPGNVTARVLG